MIDITGRIKKIFLEILPAFIFFLVMFSLLLVTRSLTLRSYGITVPASAIAVIGALVVAKVIFIADRLPFLNLYPRRPLIWTVVLKTIVFGIVTFLFLMTEELIHQARHCGSLTEACYSLKDNIVWPAFCAREIWINILLFFYCAAVELARVIGFDKVKEIFLGRRKG